MTEDKLIETILEIGILARSIDNLKLEERDKAKLVLIRKMCEDIEVEWNIEVEWKVRQAHDRLQKTMEGFHDSSR